jgi:hypothetical protein
MAAPKKILTFKRNSKSFDALVHQNGCIATLLLRSPSPHSPTTCNPAYLLQQATLYPAPRDRMRAITREKHKLMEQLHQGRSRDRKRRHLYESNRQRESSLASRRNGTGGWGTFCSFRSISSESASGSHGRQPPTKRAQRRSPEPGTDGQSAGGGISPKIVPISFCFVPLSELDGWMGMDMRGPGSAALPPSRPLARVLAPRR